MRWWTVTRMIEAMTMERVPIIDGKRMGCTIVKKRRVYAFSA